MMSVNVDWKTSLGFVGTVLTWLAVPLAVPLVFAAVIGDPLTPFLWAVGTTILLGGLLSQLRVGSDGDLGPREAFLTVALSWLGVALIGAIPFVVAGQDTIASPVNALFESMSGVTTTGSTVIEEFDVHDRSVLLWRQLLQWLGGLGILILATAILSQLSVGGAQLMETESRTRNVNKLTPHIRETARIIWWLYVALTILAIAVLYGLHLIGLAPNMTLFNAVAHALTSVSTAGFSPEAESIAAFSPAVQWALIPFMIVGATSFVLIYYVTQGELDRLRNSEEFRFYLGVLSVFSAVVVTLLVLDPEINGAAEETLRHGVFNTVSIVTTTGYANANFDTWSPGATHLLFLAMFVGGMAGSTTCSIKTVRWLVILKSFRRDLFTSIHPEAIRPIRLGGRVVDEETIRDIYAYTLVAIVLFFGLTVLIAVDTARVGEPVSEFEALGAAAATFFNIGPAFGVAGPFESFASFPVTTRIAMILAMWVGRIEMVPVLVLLTPAFWKS